MTKFDNLYQQLLNEYNVVDRNDPSFYDYVVVLLQQLRQRNLLAPEKLLDLRKVALEVVKKGYYNFIDEENNVSLKLNFLFDNENPTDKDINNLEVQITDLLNSKQPPKTIENTHEESSIDEIADFIQTKKTESLEKKGAGTETPAAVGETPSEMPGAVQPPNTSQYLKGL